MGQFSPEQLEFFYGFPTWLVAFWAIAVWGGVLGVVLLLIAQKARDARPGGFISRHGGDVDL